MGACVHACMRACISASVHQCVHACSVVAPPHPSTSTALLCVRACVRACARMDARAAVALILSLGIGGLFLVLQCHGGTDASARDCTCCVPCAHVQTHVHTACTRTYPSMPFYKAQTPLPYPETVYNNERAYNLHVQAGSAFVMDRRSCPATGAGSAPCHTHTLDHGCTQAFKRV